MGYVSVVSTLDEPVCSARFYWVPFCGFSFRYNEIADPQAPGTSWEQMCARPMMRRAADTAQRWNYETDNRCIADMEVKGDGRGFEELCDQRSLPVKVLAAIDTDSRAIAHVAVTSDPPPMRCPAPVLALGPPSSAAIPPVSGLTTSGGLSGAAGSTRVVFIDAGSARKKRHGRPRRRAGGR